MIKVKFGVSAVQAGLLVLAALVCGFVGYLSRPVIVCITAPCPQPSGVPAMVTFALTSVVIAYLVFLLYNNVWVLRMKRKKQAGAL